MFRAMRRHRQALPTADIIDILRRGTSGVLALIGDEDYPYAVPLSYVYDDGRLIFHGAKAGHKIDAIARNAKASFCVIDKDEIVPARFTTYFRSAIVFGRMRIVEDEQEKRALTTRLGQRYSPNLDTAMQQEIDSSIKTLGVLVLDIEHMSGKEAIELARQKEGN